MIVCLDADYLNDAVVTAAVGITAWTDEEPCLEHVVRSDAEPRSYRPGEFYLREMPGLLAVLSAIERPDVIVIDGYVWLATDRPGLGARLYEHLGATTPVVGVAKMPFRNHDCAIETHRGGSTRPLWITSVGVDRAEAAAAVASMHGAHRIPTILRRVDRLARDSSG